MASLVDFQDTDHQLVVGQFEEFADGTITARKLWEKCRDYRNGDQYTEEERKTLKARKQPIITDNKIQDKCDTLLGIEKQMRTDPKAYPRNPSEEDQQAAEAATDALRYIADTSDYKLKARKGAADNLMVEGLCFGQVVIDKEASPIKVCMERIRQDRGFYDIRSLEDDFSDKRYCGYFTWMDEEDVLGDFPDSRAILDTSNDGGWSSEETYDDKPRYIISQSKRKRVQVFTHYYLKRDTWYECTWVRGGFLAKPKPCTYKDENRKPTCPIEIQALYRDSDGHPYGVVPRYLDLQDEHNKRRSKMLHLLTAKRIVVQKGLVGDEDGGLNKIRAEIHKPDGVVEVSGDIEQFRVEDNLAESEGQWRLLQQTDAALSATGPNAALAGVSGDLSGIAKARDQQAGQLPISPLFDALDSWELRMYRQAWARVRQFWKAETWIRVTDNEESPKWVGLNQPVTVGDQLMEQAKNDPRFQQLPPEDQQRTMQNIAADPASKQQAVQNGKLLKRNVPGQIDVDIIIDRAPDVATLQQEEFGILAELAKTRPEVQFKTLVKLSGIRQALKREVVDELKNGSNPAAMAQQMQQVQQMGEQLTQLQQELQQKAEELKTQEAELQTARAEIQTELAGIKTERALLRADEATFNAHIKEKSAGLAIDEAGFKEAQLAAREQQLGEQQANKQVEQDQTGEALQQVGEALQSVQEQINQLAEAQNATSEHLQATQTAAQAPKKPAQLRVTRGPEGLVGELLDGESVARRVIVKRGPDGYTGTVQ